MPTKRDARRDRRYLHIDRGGSAFLPLRQMREIRWTEAVIRSALRREGQTEVWFRHVHFHCGQGCCLGTPVACTPGKKS